MSSEALALTVAALDRAGIAYAVCGAMAMPLYGVARATLDLDLLVFDRRALEPATWDELTRGRVPFEIRASGDDDDPVVGVVRIAPRRRLPIDVVMPRGSRHAAVLERARAGADRVHIEGIDLPVVSLADLILMKLDAGGPGDRDDARRLIAAAPPQQIEVARERLPSWPREVGAALDQLLRE